MPETSYDVILRLLINETGAVEKIAKTSERAAEKEAAAKEKISQRAEQAAKKEAAAKEKAAQQAIKAAEKEKVVKEKLAQQIERATAREILAKEKAAQKAEQLAKKEADSKIREIQRAEKASITSMKREAAAINRLASLRSKEIRELKERADWIERGSKALFTAGVAGVTSITLLANKYISSTKESNQLTEAWAASTQKVSDAQMRIGKVAAEAVLPIYQKLADVTGKAADFIEKNPGILEAGLKASMIVAGLGGLGLMVSKGIRLYADIQMIAVGDMQLVAAKIMSDAANKQLLAAGKTNPFAGGAGATGSAVGKGGAAVAAAGGGITAGTVGMFAALISTAAAAGYVMNKFANAIGGVSAALTQSTAIGQQVAGFFRTIFSQFAPFTIAFSNLEIGINATKNALDNKTEAEKNNENSTKNSTSAIKEQTRATDEKTRAERGGAKASADASAAIRNLASSTVGMASAAIGASNALVSAAYRVVGAAGGIADHGPRPQSGGGSISGYNPPQHDYSGYAYRQMYAMAQDGKKQFVMSGTMTRVAEQIVGGQLNQQSVLSAMRGGKQVIWNDRRHFSGEYTMSMRRENRRNTLDTLGEVFS